MMGKKKQQIRQEKEEAVKRAEEAEEAARRARAEADAIQIKEKKGFFSLFKKKQVEGKEGSATAEPSRAEPVPAPPAPAPAAPSAPALASPAEPAPAEAPKLSRREKKAQEKEEKKAKERIAELEIRLQRSEKKRRSARFCDFFAFVVLLFAALLMILGPVLKMILTESAMKVMTTVSTVAQYCLLAAIAIPAWYFVYRKNLAWKIVYVIGLVAFIVGNILGLTLWPA